MTDRRRVKRLMKIWITLGAIALVVGYGCFKAKSLAEGPRLVVESPADGSPFRDALVSVRGTAGNISFLTLNGNKIYTDESGAYSEDILLSPGYNKVTVEAQDRFGRKVTRTLQLTRI
ncbi:MAG TPA: hypothetical protein VFQ72_02515 [Candidatus Paceibacterota bacterium]|nr:hypothetical protein [Candidatus Paceibacterota bacterium]